VVSGSATVVNSHSSTAPWTGGSNKIEVGELIQLGGSGKWYEVKSVTNTSLTVTRGIEQATGTYTYAVSIQPTILIAGGQIYEESVNLTGLHYVVLQGQPSSGQRPMIHSFGGAAVFNEESTYGHLKFKELGFFVESSPAMSFTDGDVDLTIDLCDLHSSGVDAFDSASYGRYVFTKSRIESRNDVAFVGNGSSLPVRGVTVTETSFISSGGNPTSPALDIGGRKLLIIHSARAGGIFSVDKSIFSIATRNGAGEVGIAFSPSAPADWVRLTISNSLFSCTGCRGTVEPGWMTSAVSARGAGANISIYGTRFANEPGDCAVGADQGAKIVVENSSWSFDNNGNAPVCTATGGQVIY
jgi:hypothetical protein